MDNGWIVVAGAVIVAYALGTFPTALVVAGRVGHDPTAEGSNNPGASNVYRLLGRRAGVVVLLGDLAKGLVPTACWLVLGSRTLALAAGTAAVLGHVIPVTRRFRGGKGVATAGGMAVVLWPLPSLALAALFVALVLSFRIASVGSLAMAGGLPLGVGLTGGGAVEVAVAAGVAGVVIARHHENIGRLVRGEERPPVSRSSGRPLDT